MQGTAEGKPFGDRQLERMLGAGREAIRALTALQRATLRDAGVGA